MTATAFDHLKKKMTYEAVCETLGGEGVFLSENNAQLEPGFVIGSQITAVYEWTEENGDWIRVMFRNGRLHTKSRNNEP